MDDLPIVDFGYLEAAQRLKIKLICFCIDPHYGIRFSFQIPNAKPKYVVALKLRKLQFKLEWQNW